VLTPNLRGLPYAEWSAAAVAPHGTSSRTALLHLGLDPMRAELATATHLRAGVARALAGVRTKPTDRHPDGISRGALVRHCGKHHAVIVGETYDVEPTQCRQRPCPSCARARARRNATTLTRAMAVRSVSRARELVQDVEAAGVVRRVADSMFIFATLTQPKRARFEEDPRSAVRRITQIWQRITNSKHALGPWFALQFSGGLRTTETTYAARGDEREHGGVVVFSGYHAHLHVLLEVRAGIDRAEAAGWLQQAWLHECEGAVASAQCVRPANADDAYQLCKYITKPLEDAAGKPAILRELFGALHGVRLLQPFGEWMGREGKRAGWRELGAEPQNDGPAPPRWRGPEIGDLLDYTCASLRPEGTTDTVLFQGPRPGDERYVSASEAWAAIRRAVSARVLAELAAAQTADRPQKTPPRSGAPPSG
jgi:replication protein